MKLIKNLKKRPKGFTLIELLVVIAIIGLLATLAVVALNNARTKSRDAKRVSDIKQIQTALELYFVDNNAYPALGTSSAATAEIGSGTSCTSAACDCLDEDGLDDACDAGGTTYMGLVPGDPQANTLTPICDSAETTQCQYGYFSAGNSSYELYFYLEENTGGLLLGANCATSNGIANSCP